MTVEQTQLFGEPVAIATGPQVVDAGEKPLTDRQRCALDFLVDAGHDGATSDEVGAAWCKQRGRHELDERCGWDARSGNDVLRWLRRNRKAVKQLRDGSGRWVATDLASLEPATSDSGVPYNEFPEGF